MAIGRDILKTREKVVCIIGDSSIPNGMAFEALNHLGHNKTDVLVILNDNDMSISRPVGALSKYFARIITDKTYNFVAARPRNSSKMIPGVGGTASGQDRPPRRKSSPKAWSARGSFLRNWASLMWGPWTGMTPRP